MVEGANQEHVNIAEWMKVNKLSPYLKKTESMIMGYPLNTRSPDIPEARTFQKPLS